MAPTLPAAPKFLALWPSDGVKYYATLVNEKGGFNGSCTTDQADKISPDAPPGTCAAYFVDVTNYCCVAVGGIYDGTMEYASEPTCATSNYADMIDCYDYVISNHCKTRPVSPGGICTPNSTDTSNMMHSGAAPSLRTRTSSRSSSGRTGWKGMLALTTMMTVAVFSA